MMNLYNERLQTYLDAKREHFQWRNIVCAGVLRVHAFKPGERQQILTLQVKPGAVYV